MWIIPGPEEVPGLPVDTYKSKISAVHVVAKGRQGLDAANTVQVRLSVMRDCRVTCKLTALMQQSHATLNMQIPCKQDAACIAASQIPAGC